MLTLIVKRKHEDGNKESMKTVTAYLAHPFSTMAWGFEFTKKLEAIGIKVIDPFNRPGQAELNKVEEKNRNAKGQVTGSVEFSKQQSKEIVEIDMIKVRQADIIIAVVDGSDSKGTHMEFMGATFFLHMPAFTLYIQQGRIHPWYAHLSRGIARTEEELLEMLKAYLAEPKPYDWCL
jgi:nucleoside 2-deoxyribosyltransferase